jgi:hypothetical protein
MIQQPPTWLQQWSEIFAGLGTVILTVFLVLLYKRQSRQLEARHEPLLEVTDIEWYGDNAIIWISNFGNGVAKNLRLATLVKSDTGEHRSHIVRSNSLKRIDKEGDWTNLIQPAKKKCHSTGYQRLGSLLLGAGPPIGFLSNLLILFGQLELMGPRRSSIRM